MIRSEGRPRWLGRCLCWLLIVVACRPAPELPPAPPVLPAWTPDSTPIVGVPAPKAHPATPVASTRPPLPVTLTVTTPRPWLVGAAPAIPDGLRSALLTTLTGQPAFAPDLVDTASADLVVGTAEGVPLATWVYALVGPFATLTDNVTLPDLQARWHRDDGPSLLVDPAAAAWLADLWGGPPGAATQTLPAADIDARLWQRDGAWAIVPFEQLRPGWKVLALDGVSPLAADFQPDAYPLTARFNLTGLSEALTAWQWRGPVTLVNRDAGRLTRLAMTGVTALVRATAYAMERHSVTYPGEEVAAVLRAADIAHISNEVAFTSDCPYPNPIGGTTFCSHHRYFELLQYVGADVIELTGNHVNDWGIDALTHTLDLYGAANMQHFGGGRDAADAARPAEFEDHGNRIALVGCNPVGPAYAWATDGAPGARPCDGSLPIQISQLTAGGWLVIATLQYDEFYFYSPTPQQQADFRALIEAGAVAVSGSQGHHAQGFELYRDGFIHYGLGNLFFDQMDQLGTRQTFIDTYVIDSGRLISVELFTGLIEDYARPRLMTPDERQAALSAVFDASVWP